LELDDKFIWFTFQHDYLHTNVTHNHAPDIAAVEAKKVKASMRDRIRDVHARPGQVLAAGIATSSQEVRVKIGGTDTRRRTLLHQ